MRSLKEYSTSQKTAKPNPAPAGYMYGDYFDWEPEDFGQTSDNKEPVTDVWDMASEFLTMPEILTNAQVWLEERQGHMTDLLEDMLETEAESTDFVRYGSAGGF